MSIKNSLRRQLSIHHLFTIQFLTFLVAAHGIFILATALLDQIAIHRGTRISDANIYAPILIGLSLLYLSSRLHRRKQNAWIVTMLAYSFFLGLSVMQLVTRYDNHNLTVLEVVKKLVIPLFVILLLAIFRSRFIVRSDTQGFRSAALIASVMLMVALMYGISGFELMDRSDFHENIAFPAAVHYTVDQFNISTHHPVKAYSKRAHIFLDSLSFISVAAVVYVLVSLFQPLKLHFADQPRQRQYLRKLLGRFPSRSEDFFKLWPHDKQYFFDEGQQAGLAFRVQRGVALCLGDPSGRPSSFNALLTEFEAMCYGNDWTPAYIHIQNTWHRLYEKHGLTLQKIGQEAVVDLEHFMTEVSDNKYFRNINNRFTKQNFVCELLEPPHHKAVISRLRVISHEWLGHGGRVERGFVMGYFSNDYLQQCSLMVVRDAAGTIQAFINQLPAEFDRQEATYDMLRNTRSSVGNITDFLLLNFIVQLRKSGFKRLNLGLCPLGGFTDESSETKGLIDNLLKFAYANGDRFYSFSGLHRFKSKYDPSWRDRYIAYTGGVRGFSRTMSALMSSTKVHLPHR